MLISVYLGATWTFWGTGNSSRTSSWARAAEACTAIAACEMPPRCADYEPGTIGRLPADAYLEAVRLLARGRPPPGPPGKSAEMFTPPPGATL